MHSGRRLCQSIIGILLLALGSVFLKKAQLGMTPILSIPNAVSVTTSLSLGTTTILFHILCWICIVILRRKLDLLTILILPLAVVFGWVVDFYMFLMPFQVTKLWLRFPLCLCGIAFTALAIVIIVGCEGILPAPDALLRTINVKYNIPLSRVKMAGDAIWVVIAMILDLISSHKLFLSVGIGTVLGVLLAGRLVGVFGKHLPWLVAKEKEAKK